MPFAIVWKQSIRCHDVSVSCGQFIFKSRHVLLNICSGKLVDGNTLIHIYFVTISEIQLKLKGSASPAVVEISVRPVYVHQSTPQKIFRLASTLPQQQMTPLIYLKVCLHERI